MMGGSTLRDKTSISTVELTQSLPFGPPKHHTLLRMSVGWSSHTRECHGCRARLIKRVLLDPRHFNLHYQLTPFVRENQWRPNCRVIDCAGAAIPPSSDLANQIRLGLQIMARRSIEDVRVNDLLRMLRNEDRLV